MVEDKDVKKTQHNKGVTAGKRSSKGSSYSSDTDTLSKSIDAIKSAKKVKSTVKTVIELLGPSSPQIMFSSSNEADNEDSIFSNPSINYSAGNSALESVSKYNENMDKTQPLDLSLQDDSDYSMVVGKNSATFDLPDSDFQQYICPPPLLPANVLFNSECLCPQVATYLHSGAISAPCIGVSDERAVPKKIKSYDKPSNILVNWFRGVTGKRNNCVPRKYYTMNVKESSGDQCPPKRLIFDLVGDIGESNVFPCKEQEDIKPCNNADCKKIKCKDYKNYNNEKLLKENDTQNEKLSTVAQESIVNFDKSRRQFHQKTTYIDSDSTTRVDVYYFDHGNSSYFKTTDSPPIVMTEIIAEKTEAHTTKFWAEVFGSVHIGFAFFTSFILQMFRFTLYSVIRPLTIGLVQLASDYFIKPCLATAFNAVVQPPLIFLFNVATSLRDLCDPIAAGIGFFLREIAVIIRAFRIVEIRREKGKEKESNNSGKCENKSTINC